MRSFKMTCLCGGDIDDRKSAHNVREAEAFGCPSAINRSTREPRHLRWMHAVVGLYLLMANHIYIHVSRSKSGDRGLEMGTVSGLDHDFEQHRLGREIGESALMGNLNDVGA